MHSPATAYVYDKTKGCYTFITIEDYQLKYKPDCKHAYVNNMTSTDNKLSNMQHTRITTLMTINKIIKNNMKTSLIIMTALLGFAIMYKTKM